MSKELYKAHFKNNTTQLIIAEDWVDAVFTIMNDDLKIDDLLKLELASNKEKLSTAKSILQKKVSKSNE